MKTTSINLNTPTAIKAAFANLSVLPEEAFDAERSRLDAATLAATPETLEELAVLLELLADLASSGHVPGLATTLARLSGVSRGMT